MTGSATCCFYEHLFRLAPETRALFASDLAALRLKFMNRPASLVGTLERPEMFASILTHLGQLHGRAGIGWPHPVRRSIGSYRSAAGAWKRTVRSGSDRAAPPSHSEARTASSR